MIPLRFTEEDADKANEQWGANCGPTSIAAICGLTLDEVRAELACVQFEERGFMNPSMVAYVLSRQKAKIRPNKIKPISWPRWGIAYVQWEGPWLQLGVPQRARYRYTHWIGVCTKSNGDVGIFDVNVMNHGGWVTVETWTGQVVPWIMKESENLKRANGLWHLAQSFEVELAAGVLGKFRQGAAA